MIYQNHKQKRGERIGYGGFARTNIQAQWECEHEKIESPGAHEQHHL